MRVALMAGILLIASLGCASRPDPEEEAHRAKMKAVEVKTLEVRREICRLAARGNGLKGAELERALADCATYVPPEPPPTRPR